MTTTISSKTFYCTPENTGVQTWAEVHLIGQFMRARGWDVRMEPTLAEYADDALTVEAERDWQAALAYLAQSITVTQAAAEFRRKPDSLRHALQRGALAGEKSGGTWLTTRAAVVSYLYGDEPRSLHPRVLSAVL